MNESMDEMINEMNHILKCRYDVKLTHDPYSYQLNFSNCVAKPEKFRLSPKFFRLLSAGFLSFRPFGFGFVAE